VEYEKLDGLYIEKRLGGPTDIVLRRDGDRVDVVELR